MAVDWLKHAFITKFNHIRASVYGRFADVLAKDVLAAGNLGEKRKGRNVSLASTLLRSASSFAGPISFGSTSTRFRLDTACLFGHSRGRTGARHADGLVTSLGRSGQRYHREVGLAGGQVVGGIRCWSERLGMVRLCASELTLVWSL
jgi:hypothetical protein